MSWLFGGIGVAVFLFCGYYYMAFLAFCFSGGEFAAWPMNYLAEREKPYQEGQYE